MKALILTLESGMRFGCVPTAWETDLALQNGGCVVTIPGAGRAVHVLESFDEIANAMDALHVIDEDEARKRVPTGPEAADDAAVARHTVAWRRRRDEQRGQPPATFERVMPDADPWVAFHPDVIHPYEPPRCSCDPPHTRSTSDGRCGFCGLRP
jgi:hypothetical protein